MSRKIVCGLLAVLLAGGLAGCGGDDGTTTDPIALRVPAVQRLTENEDFEANPIYSPDGQWILFESDAAGNNDLYRIPAAGGQAEQLTVDPAFDSCGSWSPDGSQIVFESDRSGDKKLWVLTVEPSVGQPVQLTTGDGADGSPMWSPVADLVVFESNLDKSPGSDLWTVNTANGSTVRQTTTDDGIYNQTAGWSPDGAALVFESSRSGAPAIYTLTLASGQITQLTLDAGYEGHPAWSPDGAAIAYESTQSGTSEIYLMPAVGGEAMRLTSQGGYWPQFSPDGANLVYCTIDDVGASLWVMRLD